MKRILTILVSFILILMVSITAYAGTSRIKWSDAPNHCGETATVYGPVVDTNYAQYSNGGPTFINVGIAYPNSVFTVVIFDDARYKFTGAPERMYYGKNIEVTGTIKWYKTYAEIIVKDPSQIKIVK